MLITPKKETCNCGAIVWCYIEGYRVKPASVTRSKSSRRSLEYKQAQMIKKSEQVAKIAQP